MTSLCLRPSIPPFWRRLLFCMTALLLPAMAPAADFSGWAGKMEITLDNYDASVSEPNIPVLVKLSEGTDYFDYDHFASDTGGDLRFSAADGTTELNYEIDEWDTNGTSLVWVSIPVLTNGTTIYAYWGNASQTTPPTYSTDGSTWTNGHVGVWHMKESGNAPADSALQPNDNSGTDQGTDGVVVDAKVGKGYDYTDNGRVDISNSGDLAGLSKATLMFWYNKRDAGGGNWGSLFGRNNSYSYGIRHNNGSDPIWIRLGSWVTSTAALGNGTWNLVAFTYDSVAQRAEAFLNGTSSGSATTTASWINPGNLVGINNANDRCIDGILDEMRASSVVRSTNWFRATFMTTASNDTVTAYQTVQAPPVITNLPPTGVGANDATLRADLVSTGALATTVWVYYGDEDGEDAAGSWDTNVLVGTGMSEGAVTKAVSDLVESGIYYYRFFASNTSGTAWSPATTRFRATTDFSAWGSRMPISFTNCINATPLELFPVLVKLDENIPGFSYDQFASPTGDDLRFAAADGVTELDYEIDVWDTGGTSLMWVQIPSLTNNTQIWAYWNNAWASPGETSRTWSDRYLGVYHLHGDSNDSTANGNNGTDEAGSGTFTPNITSVVGNGIDISGGARVDLGNGTRWDEIENDNSHTFTMGVWVNPDALTDQTVFGRFGGQYLFWLDQGGLANFVIYDSGGPRTPEGTGIGAVQDEWQYVTATGDGTTFRMYVNGVLSGSSGGSYSLEPSSVRMSLGTENGNSDGRALDGSLDEARVAYACRSEEWIRTEFLNMASNDFFNTLGTVQSAPFIETLPVANIGGLSADMRVDVVSTGTAETTLWVYYGTSDGTNNPAAWGTSAYAGVVSAEGAVSTNITGLQHETTYYYRFFASNSVGTTWAYNTETFDTTTDFTRWAQKVEIAFTNYNRATPLTNFPALVKLGTAIPGFSYSRFESDQGVDLRFSAADGTTSLNYEIEAWDTDGESTVWVQVPVLTNNTSIRAYWGSASDTGAGCPMTGTVAWGEEYIGVYHLHADSNDSSTNAQHGVNEAGPVSIAGVVSDGLDVAGGARVDLGGSGWDAIDNAHHNTFTMGAWVNPDSLGSDGAIFGRLQGAGQQFLVWLDVGDGLVNYVVYDDAGPRTPPGTGIAAQQDTWQYVVATCDGTLFHMYVDGQLSGSSPATVSLAPSTMALSLGTDNGNAGSRALDGSLDEARISYACRPIDWIWAEYMNMASNAVFNTYGTVEYNNPADPIVANLAPTGTTYQSAFLRGYLTSTGTAETTVWVYWGDEDGTNNKTAWDTGTLIGAQSAEGIVLSEEVTGLNDFSTYYYRFYASNTVGGVWADETEQFGTALRMGEWTHMLDIDVPYDRSTPLTNFPVLVVLATNITGFSYDDFAYPDSGIDLRFTPTDGRSLLNYEIEEWNSNGNSYVWVQVPELVSNTTLHAFWGNPNVGAYASTTNGATWDDTFRAVWHLDQVSGASDLTDATTNDCDGTNYGGGGGSDNVDGLISKGQDFERGDTDYIDLATTPSSQFLPAPGSAITLSCWVKAESIESGAMVNRMISIHDTFPAAGSALSFSLSYDDNVEIYHDGTDPDDNLVSLGTVALDQWHHVVAACDGSDVRLYIDGVLDSSEPDSLNAGSAYTVKLGNYATAQGQCFDGIIDELRVSAVSRSADWVYACWLNQRSNTVFDAYGTVQDNFDANLPTIDALAATDIMAVSATMNGSLTSTGSSATAVTLFWGTTDELANGLQWQHAEPFPGTYGVGSLPTNITGLTEDTTYYYRFRASNAAGDRWSTTVTFDSVPFPDVNNAGGADALIATALLNGNLIATNGAPCGAFIYWGTSDGGSNAAAWANTNVLGAMDQGAFDAGAPPATWTNLVGTDIGGPTHAGSAGYTSGVWTVSGGGANIHGGSDQCYYAYRQVRGDFDVYCRMSDYTGGTSGWRKGGIMARNSLAANSRNAFAMRSPAVPNQTIRFQRRVTDGGGTSQANMSNATNAYYWLRLKRFGDDFSVYWADDDGGAPDTWGQVGGSLTIDMDDTIYLGLAITAQNDTQLTSATFDGWGGTAGLSNLLTYGQQYYYRSSATNLYGRGWADSTANFLTAQPDWVSVDNTTATDITTTSATFNATLDAELAIFDVYAYWGATDEGTDPGAWTHSKYVGTYSNVTGLDVSVTDDGMTVDTPYFYTFQGTNIAGDIWAAPSASFRSMGAPAVTNATPQDYTNGTATVGGVLTYGGSGQATVYWGLSDEGQNAGAWDTATVVGHVDMGLFQTNITVGAGGTYYYRVYVTNDVDHAWAPSTASFVTPGATISIADATVYEGQSGTTNMIFTVTPSLPCASNVTVRCQTANDTAVAPGDYTAVDTILSIPAMQAQGTIAVPVIGDTDVEWPDEIFYVNLSAATNATIADGQAIGTIGDDDIDVKDWQYKMRITFDGYTGSETLRDFPALVTFDNSIAQFDYSQFESPHGHDLRFADDNQVRMLSYEIEHWDTNGTSYVWVRVPELSGTDTAIWAYWGCTNDLQTVSAATDVPDCVLWLRADAGVQTNGASVTGWLDQSGWGNNASQTTNARQPTLVQDVLNGNPILRFDGSNDKLVVNDHSSLDNTAGLTIFVVVTPSNLSNNPRATLSKRVNSSTAQSYSQFFWGNTVTLRTDIDTGNNRFASTTVFANGNTYITELVYDGTLASHQRAKLGVDGSHEVTAAETSASIPDYASPLVIGALDDSYGTFLGGDFAEIIIYRRALTTNETLSVGRYLEQKYALGSSYETDAPVFASDGSTWSADYGGVWHLREGGTGTRRDSTTNDNDSVALGGDPQAAAGRIAGGNDFDGTGDLVRVADSASIGDETVDSMSVSVWLKPGVDIPVTGDNYRALEKGNDYFLLQGNNGNLGSGGMNFFTKTPTSSGEVAEIGVPLTSGQWYHITGTFDGTDMRVYLDGVLEDTHYVGENIRDDNEPLWIGSDDSGKEFLGVMDELRISQVARSADWVRAAYENMADTAAFQTRSGVVVTHGPTLFILR